MSGGMIGTDPKVIRGIEKLQKNRTRDILMSSVVSGFVGALIGYILGIFS